MRRSFAALALLLSLSVAPCAGAAPSVAKPAAKTVPQSPQALFASIDPSRLTVIVTDERHQKIRIKAPFYASPQAALEAVAKSCENDGDKERFAIAVNVPTVCDMAVFTADPDFGKGGRFAFNFKKSDIWQQNFHYGASTRLARYFHGTEVEYLGWPWEPAALRAAGTAKVTADACTAEVTNSAGKTAWLTLRQTRPGSWRVIAVSPDRKKALLCADEALWKQYLATKITIIRDLTADLDKRWARARSLYKGLRVQVANFKADSGYTFTTLTFTATVTNDTDLPLSQITATAGCFFLREAPKRPIGRGGLAATEAGDKLPHGVLVKLAETIAPHSTVTRTIVRKWSKEDYEGYSQWKELLQCPKDANDMIAAGKTSAPVVLVRQGVFQGPDGNAIKAEVLNFPPSQGITHPDLNPDYEFGARVLFPADPALRESLYPEGCVP